jgi:hypothetical protein
MQDEMEELLIDAGAFGKDETDDDPHVTAVAQNTDAHKLLTAIWHADANGALSHVHIIAEKTLKGFKHFSVNDVDEAVATAIQVSARGHDAYFACAEYEKFTPGAKGNREAANARGAYALWLDLDAGANKPYPDKQAAVRALRNFCKQVGFPKPMIVDSGNAFHVYWYFDTFINKEDWGALAERLKALCTVQGFEPGAERTADIASVLRVPDTENWKKADDPKPVQLRHRSSAQDLNAFLAALDANAPPPPPAAAKMRSNIPSSAAPNYTPSSALEIIKHCATLAHVAAVRGAVNEPLWRVMLGVVKHTTEGEALCHQWSRGDPRYNQSETQGKIDGWTKGPALCGTIRSLQDARCQGCAQMCKSPIQLGVAGRAAIAEFNDSHFVAKVGGDVYVFDERDENLLAGGMSFAAFRNLHANKQVNGKNAAAEWFISGNRRTYEGLVFDPSGRTARNVYNTWRGLAVEPKKGQCGLIVRHILSVLCNGNREQWKYVMKWMAGLVQRPWLKPEVALVLRSKEGAGKDIIVQVLLNFFGPHAFTTSQKDQVAGRFNAHLFDKVLVVLNEAFFAGDPSAVATAKMLVTNQQIGYEAKGKDTFSAKNFVHVIILTNNTWAVPAGEDARRWAVLDVNETRIGDHAYFNRLAREIKNGGSEAFLDFLMRINLRGFNPRDLPTTVGLQKQRVETVLHNDVVAAWWLTVLSDGEFLQKDGTAVPWGQTIAASDLQASYDYAAARARHAPPFPVAAKRLRALVPPGALSTARLRANAGARYRQYKLPPIKDAQRHFQDAMGIDPCAF